MASSSMVELANFNFPYSPYELQSALMQEIYNTLESKRVGIFESPTGTGKTLCLLCSSITWLLNNEKRSKLEIDAILSSKENDNGDDWLTSFADTQRKKEEKEQLLCERKKLLNLEQRLEALKMQSHCCAISSKGYKRKSRAESNDTGDAIDIETGGLRNSKEKDVDADVVLEEYNSEDESVARKALPEDNPDSEVFYVKKIFYCSRTHSQLAQVLSELRKTVYGKQIRVVTLGSRKNLCLNEAVKKLGSLSLMNERCLDLRQKSAVLKRKCIAQDNNSNGSDLKPTPQVRRRPLKKEIETSCPFDRHQAVLELADEFLVEVQDIEDMVSTAQQSQACPYFAARAAVHAAQLVLLPYHVLFHKQTRESCGIRLDGNVIIIDEAHNLLDTVAAIHSVEITLLHVKGALSELEAYVNRYLKRLTPKNLMYCSQMVQVLRQFLNFFKLLAFLNKSELANKLRGFSSRYGVVSGTTDVDSTPIQEQTKLQPGAASVPVGLKSFLQDLSLPSEKATAKNVSQHKMASALNNASSTPVTTDFSASGLSTVAPLLLIQSFIECLTNTAKDGRVVFSKEDTVDNCRLKFVLLNPAVYFEGILSTAKAVILAGGTMEPISEVSNLLLHPCGVSQQEINIFTCSHIIPDSNLLSLILTKGPSGKELQFAYDNRYATDTLSDACRLLLNLCNVIPDGIVCFFPSYAFEAAFFGQLKTDGGLYKLEKRKRLFRDFRATAGSSSDQLLTEYVKFTKSIAARHSMSKVDEVQIGLTGAVLFSVVGGKLSEGINFSDELGRCVIVFGMPYPNIQSTELKEKMNYLNRISISTTPQNGVSVGQLYYENLCMKAVNQSIGRAIRHKDDYACIVLVDCRYAKRNIIDKLPGWIRKRTSVEDNFGPTLLKIRQFFAAK